MRKITGYVGTYASSASLGVYRFKLDGETGALSAPSLFCEAPDAKYLSLHGPHLAAPFARDGKAGLCLLDTRRPETPYIAECSCETRAACYVAQYGKHIYTANYHEGTVLVYERAGRTLQRLRRIEIAPQAGCHQVLLSGGLLFVPCLELDSIRLFDIRRDYAPAGQIAFPSGSGPRHAVFDENHSCLYVLGERSNTLYMFDSAPPFALRETLPLLSPGASQGAESAALRRSGDGRFLYASTRGANLLSAVLRAPEGLRLVQQHPSGGDHPRDFVLTPDGRFLLVANRFSGNLCCFARDNVHGKIGALCGETTLPEAVAIVLAIP